ncbi:MAG: hypothetical protein ACI8UO_005643 [Verrucomicrobiales bacterium]|jgi:hypothetical protein
MRGWQLPAAVRLFSLSTYHEPKTHSNPCLLDRTTLIIRIIIRFDVFEDFEAGLILGFVAVFLNQLKFQRPHE